MTARPSDSAANRPYEIAIVGNDMLLAALPGRPIQFAHALLAAGYDLVVPVSWGEELLADHVMTRLEQHGPRPTVYCACPDVRSRLLQSGRELVPHLIATVAPPVATSRYLRAMHGDVPMRITYLGACAGARDASIDRAITPAEVLRELRERRISVVRQPAVYDAVVPPDRRRHWSLPGGLPSNAALEERKSVHTLRVLDTADFAAELADYLLRADAMLLDVAGCVGCACAGVIDVHRNRATREAVMALEPPRATTPVIDADASIVLEAPLPHLVDLSVRSLPAPESPKPTLPAHRPTAPTSARTAPDPTGGARRSQERHRIAVTPPGIGSIVPPQEARATDAAAATTSVSSVPRAATPQATPAVPADATLKPSAEPTPMPNHHPRPSTEGGPPDLAAPEPPVQVRRRTPAHALHLTARGSLSTRVSTQGGATLPRAYAAVRHRTPSALPAIGDLLAPSTADSSAATSSADAPPESPTPAVDRPSVSHHTPVVPPPPALAMVEAPLLPMEQPVAQKPQRAAAPPPPIEMVAPIATVLEPAVTGPVHGTPRHTPRHETARDPAPTSRSTRRLWTLLWWSVAILALSAAGFLLYGGR